MSFAHGAGKPSLCSKPTKEVSLTRRAKLITFALSVSGVYGTIGLLFMKYQQPVVGCGCMALSVFAFIRRALTVHARL
jgi:hypothetical protein